jgi:radical SAM superfamily enzyme YgiQ (UPF0313 family)
MTFNAPRAYEIADKFRKDKRKTVIAGGFHPTFLPIEALEHADAVCVGEAENIVSTMVEDFQNGRMKSVYRSAPVDLGSLRVPDRSLIRRSLYAVPDALQATRGCPQRCKFCSITEFFGHKFRVRPVEKVIAELETLRNFVLFLDDNIATDAGYAKELFRQMIPLKKRWFSQCSIRIAYDDELLDLAARSGCRGLFIGFESVIQENLKGWGKNFNRAHDFDWAVRKIHAKGIGVMAAIVFGDDGDTRDIFRATLDFLLTSNVDALQATLLTPFPGTPLFEEMDRAGRIVDKDWAHYNFRHVVFEPKNMSREELERGKNWVLHEFYSIRSVGLRFAREVGYLSPSTIARVTVPLNLGYRTRLTADGTFGVL